MFGKVERSYFTIRVIQDENYNYVFPKITFIYFLVLLILYYKVSVLYGPHGPVYGRDKGRGRRVLHFKQLFCHYLDCHIESVG